MALTLKPGREKGTIRPWWYFEFYRPDGTRTVINLNVPVEGTPPVSRRVTDEGDAAFERSRERAKVAAEVVRLEATRGRRERTAALRTFKETTGTKLVVKPASALRSVFDENTENYSEKWVDYRRSAVGKFADWMKEVLKRETGFCLAQIYDFLRKAELAAGVLFLRQKRKPTESLMAKIARVTQTKRTVGCKSASRYDFHCFRTSFITIAIATLPSQHGLQR